MLTIGLVTFPVHAYNIIASSSQLSLNLLHRPCHSRIRYVKTCPVHGPVSQDEIVSAYEYAKGQYVEIEPEEMEAIRGEHRRTLNVHAFITPEELDPIYLDGRMYYLLPAESEAEEPYELFRTAMRKSGHSAIGDIIMSGKPQAVLIRVHDDALVMAMLNYSAEIRPPSAIRPDSAPGKANPKKLKLVEMLIQEWTPKTFDFAEYTDRSHDELEEIIKAKVEGHEVVAPAAEEEPAETINLLDALRKSISKRSRSQGNGQHRRGGPAKTKSHRKSRRRTA